MRGHGVQAIRPPRHPVSRHKKAGPGAGFRYPMNGCQLPPWTIVGTTSQPPT